MLILVGVTGLFVFFADLAGGYMLALDFVIVVIFLGALRLIVALRRWASSPSGQRSGALDRAICGANATLLTVIFLVAAVVALPLSLWAYQTVALPTWFLIGTLLGWYSVPITTAIGALYGALVHRVIIISDTSLDEPPLSRITDATLAP